MRILVVDDYKSIRLLLQHQLECDGHEVVLVSGGDAAIAALTEDPGIQLALVDWNMPGGLDGVELIREIQQFDRLIYTIVVTSADESEYTATALDSGAHDYIIKPWHKETLLARVRVACRVVSMQSELYLRGKALESAANAIVITDRNGRIEWVNQAFTRLTGYTREESVGENPRVLKSNRHDEAFYAKIWETVLAGGTWCGEIINRRKDGTVYTEDMTITPVHTGEQVTHFIAVKQDVTQRNQMRRQLDHTQRMESIGELAAGIAHEINTPIQYVGDNICFVRDSVNDLVSLIGHYETAMVHESADAVDAGLRAKIDAAHKEADLEFVLQEVAQAISQSLDGVERVSSIVRAMKDFSHPGTSDRSSIDLNDSIQCTITVCRNRWKYVAEMVTDLCPDLPPLNCHAGEINQVILNLIVNAADAIHDASGDDTASLGTITVRTCIVDEGIEISVSDTGPGISDETCARVFDPFFTTKEVGKGTGQGLAISHDAVCNKHDGELRLETEVGVGTTFFVWLPIG